MTRRTPHGDERHSDPDRPTSEAVTDRAAATEIYLDLESDYYIFVGARGRTHVFTADGLHHTSFRTTHGNRFARERDGKWQRVGRDQLPVALK
jgi:hypothetical protein